MHRSLFFYLLWLLCLSNGLLTAQDTVLIDRSKFFRQKDIHSLQLSADGKTVYYQRHSAGSKVLCYRSEGSYQTEHRIRMASDIADWRPTFLGGLLFFLKDASSGKLMHTDEWGEQPREIAPFSMRDAEILAMSGYRPAEVALRVVRPDTSLNGIYAIDIKSADFRRIGTYKPRQEIYFDGELSPKAALRPNRLGGYSVYVKRDSVWEELRRYPFDEGMLTSGFQEILSVTADGKYLFLTDNLDKDKTTLLEVEIASGEQRELVADPRCDILAAGAVVRSDGWPQMVQGWFGTPQRHFLDRKVREDFAWLSGQMEGVPGFVTSSGDDRYWLVREMDGGPQSYFLFRRSPRRLSPLFSDYSALEGEKLASREAVSVTTRDGLELPLQLYLPPGTDTDADGRPDRPLPTILFVHDGPWGGLAHWNDWSYLRHFQLLANRGYVVINTEFRGSTGLGKTFTRRGDRELGDAMHQDLLDVARWAVRENIAADDRLGIWGWSYGGYASTLALARAPGLFACGLSMSGWSDLETLAGSAYVNQKQWRRSIGNPAEPEDAQLLNKYSPINYVRQIRRPLLLTAGGQDNPVSRRQVDTLANSLHRYGREIIYLRFPREGRLLEKPESWIAFWAAAEEFLHLYLNGKYQEAGEALQDPPFEQIYGMK